MKQVSSIAKKMLGFLLLSVIILAVKPANVQAAAFQIIEMPLFLCIRIIFAVGACGFDYYRLSSPEIS